MSLSTSPTRVSAEPLAYTPTRFRSPIDLDLSRNEGTCCLDQATRREVASDPSLLERYPDASTLESLLAKRLDIDPNRVLVTAGGDDAIERLCRLATNNQSTPTALLHTPTFEMIEIYCRAFRAKIDTVRWLDGPFPTEELIARCDEDCSLVSLVSPNNPTGSVITLDEMTRVIKRARNCDAVVLVDLAYVEFADQDPTQSLLDYDNVVMIRTFSKAWGLAGLRVGYAVGQPDMIARMRAIGAPYATSGLSLALAERALRDGESEMTRNVAAAQTARKQLAAAIQRCGGSSSPSAANFILARFENTPWIRDAAASLGIATRTFENNPLLNNAIRFTCPTKTADLQRITNAIETATAPQAILFDVDGVLVDVSRSYRQAIIDTAATFGVTITDSDIERIKAAGNANNDWIVTHKLIIAAGADATFEDVRSRFERIYQGDEQQPGLRASETLIPTREWLRKLSTRFPLGLVTGRPRSDAQAFLKRFDLQSLFSAVVTLDDAPAKPDPAPVRLALKTLGVTRAWMIGDTVDDINAARSSGVIPIGINAPQANANTSSIALRKAGAARILKTLTDIEDLLP